MQLAIVRCGGDDAGASMARNASSARLQELAPGLSVVRGPERLGGDEFLRWRVASALQVGLLLTWFLTVLLLVAAPRTRRATPYAWFWLLLTPVGVPAFLLLLAVGWGQAEG